jgi:predicted amidohydrolase YtcJ
LLRSEPEQLTEWRRIAREIAKARLPLHVHAELEDTIDAFLDQIETINKEYPVMNLRWVFAHVNRINAAQLARMKELGMYAAVNPWAVINELAEKSNEGTLNEAERNEYKALADAGTFIAFFKAKAPCTLSEHSS